MLEKHLEQISTEAWAVLGVASATLAVAAALASPDLKYMVIMILWGAVSGSLGAMRSRWMQLAAYLSMYFLGIMLLLVRDYGLWWAMAAFGVVGLAHSFYYGLRGKLHLPERHWLSVPMVFLLLGLMTSYLPGAAVSQEVRELTTSIAEVMTAALLAQAVVLFLIGGRMAFQDKSGPPPEGPYR